MKLFAIIVALAIANVLADNQKSEEYKDNSKDLYGRNYRGYMQGSKNEKYPEKYGSKEWEDKRKMDDKEWEEKMKREGNGWEQKKMEGNEWEQKKMEGNGWEQKKKEGNNEWDQKKMEGNGWEQMKMDGNGWQQNKKEGNNESEQKKTEGNNESEQKNKGGNNESEQKKKEGNNESEQKKNEGNNESEQKKMEGNGREQKKMEGYGWEQRMGSEKYTDKYDSMDLDAVMGNKRLMQSYSKCMLDQGKCTAEGKELKSHISDALQNGCAKCTDTQRQGMKKVIKHYMDKEPDTWDQMVQKYDPNRMYSRKYEKELKNMKH